jgi:hypothetical protein
MQAHQPPLGGDKWAVRLSFGVLAPPVGAEKLRSSAGRLETGPSSPVFPNAMNYFTIRRLESLETGRIG